MVLSVKGNIAGNEEIKTFTLAKGRYLLAVERTGMVADPEALGRIRYHLEIPQAGISVLKEPVLCFNFGIMQIRLEDFALTHQAEGKVIVEVVSPMKTDFEVRIRRNPFP